MREHLSGVRRFAQRARQIGARIVQVLVHAAAPQRGRRHIVHHAIVGDVSRFTACAVELLQLALGEDSFFGRGRIGLAISLLRASCCLLLAFGGLLGVRGLPTSSCTTCRLLPASGGAPP